MLKYQLLLCTALLQLIGFSQVQTEKVVTNQSQVWVSLNNTILLDNHFVALADLHLRRTDFLESESFYMVRGALGYLTDSKRLFALGYGHYWYPPSGTNFHKYTNENFTYQLFQFNSNINTISVLHRFRNEQRWQQIMVNDAWTGQDKFTDRIRYLISFNIPIFKKKSWPSLAISDEIMIQFGKDIVYNTFDQNRIFIGIKQSITPKISFDFGYMNVYQEKKSGYQYDNNHTLRLFFYYKNDVKSLMHFAEHS